MELPLIFRPLAVPLSKKALLAFRKDAGWVPGAGDALSSKHPRGKVQWVTVDCGKKMIGIARLELAPPEFCYLSDLIISSAYRGQGVGDWFMKNIERYCLQSGIPRVLLQPVEDTKGFYKKMHFVADPYVPTFLKKDINPFQRKVFAY